MAEPGFFNELEPALSISFGAEWDQYESTWYPFAFENSAIGDPMSLGPPLEQQQMSVVPNPIPASPTVQAAPIRTRTMKGHSGVDEDRRRKNNEAVRRSRQRTKEREMNVKMEHERLEKEVRQLRKRVADCEVALEWERKKNAILTQTLDGVVKGREVAQG